MIIYEEELNELTQVCERLARDALAKAIFVVDQDGQLVTSTGETTGIDTTGMASLVASTTAATSGLAPMFGEADFPVHFHEGKDTHMHISVISEDINSLILVVVFDDRSSLGLVRLRVKRAYQAIKTVLEKVTVKMTDKTEKLDLFGEITDDDIDSLFGDFT